MRENKASSGQMDLLHGPLFKNIILFAIPLAASSMLQQMFNFADVAVVGRFAGSEAMAAVGANGSLINLFVTLFVGLSVGANVVIARHIGEGKTEKIHDAVQTSVLVAILSGLFVTLLGISLAGVLHGLIATPDNILADAKLYMRIYCSFAPFIMLYNFGAAILRSASDTKRPMYCLVVGGVLNVILNLILVIVFQMGVAGVAIATGISNVVSSVMVITFLTRETGFLKLDLTKLYIRREPFLQILRIGVPAGFQSTLFSVSNVLIQSATNTFGASGIAGTTVATNFDIMAFYMVVALNQATMTFISQNYGAGNMKRCREVFRLTVLTSLAAMATVNLTVAIFAPFFVGMFTNDPEVIAYAVIRVRVVHILQWMIVSYETTSAAMRGLGYSLQPTIIIVVTTCVFRVFWIMTIFAKYRTFMSLIVAYPATWVIAGSAMIVACRRSFRKAELKLTLRE